MVLTTVGYGARAPHTWAGQVGPQGCICVWGDIWPFLGAIRPNKRITCMNIEYIAMINDHIMGSTFVFRSLEASVLS